MVAPHNREDIMSQNDPEFTEGVNEDEEVFDGPSEDVPRAKNEVQDDGEETGDDSA
jgi:hypothetical protein